MCIIFIGILYNRLKEYSGSSIVPHTYEIEGDIAMHLRCVNEEKHLGDGITETTEPC